MKFIFGLIIWIFSISILGIPLGILRIYKLFLDAIVKRQKWSKDEEWFPLSPNDSLEAPDSSWIKSDSNIGFILKLKRNDQGKYFSVQELRDHFSKRFLQNDIKGGKYDRLSSYIAAKGGYTYRVHKHSINLDNHIYEWDRNNNRDQCLENILTEWMSLKWEKKKPCWEIILIEDLSKTGELILAFKIHHALADGYSLLHILDVLTGNTSPYLERDFEGETKFTKIMEGIKCAAYLHRMNGFPPKKNPFRVKLTESNYYDSFITFTSFPLDGIKAIRRKHDVHVISIIFAIILGALRRYREKDLKAGKIPTDCGLFTTQQWPRHPSRDSNNQNKDKICNHWSLTTVKVSLEEKDPIRRMMQIENELENYKNLGLHKFLNRIFIPVLSTLPSSPLHRLFSKDSGLSVGVTSIMGGDNYSLLGCKAERICPLYVCQDVMPYGPLGCFTFSHSGIFEMMMRFHPSVVKDQETANKISQEFCAEEFNALLEASNLPKSTPTGSINKSSVFSSR